MTAADLPVAQLTAGHVVSGHHHSLVYAAAPIPGNRGNTIVLVLTRRADAGLRFATTWFLWSAAAVVVLGVGVALGLSRRLTRPIRDADAATRRIAAGELSTRIAEDPRHDDEMANLVRSINTMAATLERSKGLEQQFLLSVSHDLRTPLTSIRGYAEAITDGATKDPQWAAGVILAEAARLERLVRDLLDLAKLESRSFSLHLETLDLAAVAQAGARRIRPRGRGRRCAGVGLRNRGHRAGRSRPVGPGRGEPRRERPQVRRARRWSSRSAARATGRG